MLTKIKGMRAIMRAFEAKRLTVAEANDKLKELGYKLCDTDGDSVYYLYPL